MSCLFGCFLGFDFFCLVVFSSLLWTFYTIFVGFYWFIELFVCLLGFF